MDVQDIWIPPLHSVQIDQVKSRGVAYRQYHRFLKKHALALPEGFIPLPSLLTEGLLDERIGHTELVVSILKMADLVPAGSGCEIMGDNGKALSKDKAKQYAHENGLVFLEGKEIVKAWKQWSK